jgi:serine/threonine protein kinase
MPLDSARIKDIFLAAVGIVDPTERAAYLDKACGDEDALRQRVEALLQEHVAAASLREESDADTGHTEASAEDAAAVAPGITRAEHPAETVGSHIGPYKLLQKLGEGGMGIVWAAEQMEPVKRRVAVKVIKPGMDSAQVLRRFAAERQALAMMDHTNIARVLDGGTTPGGRPYFVMEMVKGVPLLRYCDEMHLSVVERLELFIPICQAIQHAHQKGIIHRDIKPSNVLVAMQDNVPVPKVIDFGVAKALNQQLTDESLYTEIGAMVGTLEYMSPEQAELNALDIDTRADIYALGVMLYELLTGSTPLDRKRLRVAAHAEMLRMIREEEPPRPSTRLSQSKQTIASLAALRKTEPRQLRKALRGDLDWITMKCLEKDRTRRYETANGLARDLQRFLGDEPVEACPPSSFYKLRKFLRKHRSGVLTGAAFVMLLLTASTVSTLLAVRAWRSEARALEEGEKARGAARAEQERAEGERIAKETAQKRLEQLEKGNNLLGSIFKGIDVELDEKEEKPLRILLGEKLETATKELEGDAVGNPLSVARLQSILGATQRSLGYQEKAIACFKRALPVYKQRIGPDDPETLACMNDLAWSYQKAGKVDLALPLNEEVFKLRKAKLGPEHLDTLESMNDLATAYSAAGKLELALQIHAECFRLHKSTVGSEHPRTLISMNNLAQAYEDKGQYKDALPICEENFRLHKATLGADHTNTLISMTNLSRCYRRNGDYKKALTIAEEAVKLCKTALGPDHPYTLTSIDNLASTYHSMGRVGDAVSLFEEALNRARAKRGVDYPQIMEYTIDLAAAYRDSGKPDKAIPLIEDVLKERKERLGADDSRTMTTMQTLAATCLKAGDFARAVSLYEETIRCRKAVLGPEHRATLVSMHSLAEAYLETNNLQQAIPRLEQTLQARKAALGPEDPDTLLSMNDLGLAYLRAGKFDSARPLLEEALTARRRILGSDHPHTLLSVVNLAAFYNQTRKHDLSIPLYEEIVRTRNATLGSEHALTIDAIHQLAVVYALTGNPARSIPLFEQALAYNKAKLGSDNLNTVTTLFNLGFAYARAGRLDDAVARYEEAVPLYRVKPGLGNIEAATCVNLLAQSYVTQKSRKKQFRCCAKSWNANGTCAPRMKGSWRIR